MPTVLDLGNSRKKDDYLAEGKASLLDLEMEVMQKDRVALSQRRLGQTLQNPAAHAGGDAL